MRILVTNDDGIQAPALVSLVEWAKILGEVLVVAPLYEQSGKSQGIDIIHPFHVEETTLAGVKAYAVDSTPADCVRFAILGLKEEFDLVISGINRGFNLGRDIVYSGTVGAIYEAANLGVKSLALSTAPSTMEMALKGLGTMWAYFEEHALFQKSGIFNVNFPMTEPVGIRITRQGGPYYSDVFTKQEDGTYTQTGIFVFEESGNLDLDTDSTLAGYISITPLTQERTDLGVYEALKELNS